MNILIIGKWKKLLYIESLIHGLTSVLREVRSFLCGKKFRPKKDRLRFSRIVNVKGGTFLRKMLDTEQEELLHLSSSFSKILKRRFGKGPEACFVISHENRLIITIRHFLTPPEEVLLGKNKTSLIDQFRSAVMDLVFEEFAHEVYRVYGGSYTTYFADWDYMTNSALLVMEGQEKEQMRDFRMDPHFQDLLSEEILKNSVGIQKPPSLIDVIKVRHNLVIAVCVGVLMPIDKLMYEQQQFGLLSERSREIKRGFLAKMNGFEQVFSREVANLYITWDYQNDTSHMFFSLK